MKVRIEQDNPHLYFISNSNYGVEVEMDGDEYAAHIRFLDEFEYWQKRFYELVNASHH